MNKWLIVTLLVLSSFSAQADKAIFNIGEIVEINAKTISFDDQFFIMSSTVKVWNVNKKKISLSKLKVGDYVALTMIKVAKKSYVDHIYVSPFGK